MAATLRAPVFHIRIESVFLFYNDQAFLTEEDVLARMLVEIRHRLLRGCHRAAPESRQLVPDGARRPQWSPRCGPHPRRVGGPPRIGPFRAWKRSSCEPWMSHCGGCRAARLQWRAGSCRDRHVAVRLGNASTGRRAGSLSRRQDHPFSVRARLADGVSLEQGRAAMEVLAGHLATTYPELNTDRDISVLSVLYLRVTPEADPELASATALSMGIVILVLVIGTLNLANLLLIGSTAQAREIAVRLALGASTACVISCRHGRGGAACRARGSPRTRPRRRIHGIIA
jgi:hypothetical protein